MLRFLYLTIFAVLLPNPAQSQWGYSDLMVLLRIDSAAGAGNINAFYRLADYLDSDRVVADHLGRHELETPLKMIARRLIKENTLFLESEFNNIDKPSIPRLLKQFLQSNRENIRYSRLSGTYLITPEEGRGTKYKLVHISPLEQKEAENFVNDQLKDPQGFPGTSPGWHPHMTTYREAIAERQRFRELMKCKDPEVLKEISGIVYKSRQRWYSKKGQQDYYKLTSLLTGMELYVPGDDNKMVCDLSGYQEKGLYNFMVYWATHYKEYHWSEERKLFINTK